MTSIGDIAALAGQPLTARSVIASTLLGMSPPRMSARLLTRSGELFGISAGTTRTALSRMVAAGELTADDATYELAGPLLDRRRRQLASRSARPGTWDGTWRLEVVRPEARPAADRAELRQAMRRLRLVEWREGLWARPANLADPGPGDPDGEVVRAQCDRVDGARPHAPPVDRFDLAGWARRAEALVVAMEQLTGPLDDGDLGVLADGFVLSAAVIRHVGADPLLPAELLPGDWPGARLRRVFDSYDRAFARTHREWFSEQAAIERR